MVFSKIIIPGRFVCLFAALAVVSCAPGAGQQRVMLEVPPIDGDSCYDQARVPFYRISNTALAADQAQAQANATNRGIAGIGMVATVAGLAAGGRAGNIVAGIGALTTLVAALNSNVQTDQRFIGDVSLSFNGLVACRTDEAAQIRRDVRARRLSAAEGRARLVRVRDLMLVDVDVAQRVNYALSQRNQTYALEVADVDTRISSEPASSDRQQRAAQAAQTRQTIQSNQRALTDQVTAINKAAQTITVTSIDAPAGATRAA